MSRAVKIGTDCSGMETPVMALRQLHVPYEHCFSSDIDRNVKKQILANFPPQEFYDNLLKRKNTSSKTPKVDVYLAGFPCQPFSSAGLGKGLKDKRGNVFFGCAEYISEKRPKVFILENVRGLLRHRQGKTFKRILGELEHIGKGCYDISWKLLNSQDHGTPQSRPRLYIVGLLRSAKVSEFEFPGPLPPVSLDSVLDPVEKKPTMGDLPVKLNGEFMGASSTGVRNLKKHMRLHQRKGHAPLRNTWCMDIDASPHFFTQMKNRVMCMTKSRAAGFWLSSRGRRMNLDEMLRCQGMERSFKQVVSDRALGGQIGNAMGQNILERLFVKLLPAAGLVPSSRRLTDRWAAAAKKAAMLSGAAKKAKRKAPLCSNAGGKKRAKTS